MPRPKVDFRRILEILAQHQVDFIVVGGICAVLHGAPIATFDLDVVHSRRPENIERLLAALEALQGRYRAQPDRQLKPDRSHLSSPGHQLLMTRFGPLDVLGSIAQGRDYDRLISHTTPLIIKRGITVRLLSLETLIEVKQETGRAQDKAVLPILRRTLQEKSKS